MPAAFIHAGSAGVVIGVALQDVLGLNAAFAAFLLLLAAGVLIYARSLVVPLPIMLIGVLLLGATLGSVRMGLVQADDRVHTHALDGSLGQEVMLTGVVADEPDARETYTNLVVRLPSGGHVLARTDMHTAVQYGDEVVVSGILERPENFASEEGRVFDYRAYLAKDGIQYTTSRAQVGIHSSGNGNPLKAVLFSLKEQYVGALGRVVPEPEAGLAAGITVGTKQALGGDMLDAFRRVGLVHIVVLSGFNITVIIIFLLQLFVFLPRWARYTCASTVVVLFTMLTGADAPVVRASIMGLIGVLALTLGRTYNITRALLAVGVGMVLWNPHILLHDIAFQLSFVATLGLVYVSPYILRPLEVRLPQWLSEIVAATVATQLAVLPLLIYYMGEVSVVAPLVNILTLPLIPAAMLASFLTGLVGMFSTALAAPFAYVTYALLHYVMVVVQMFNALPFATLQIAL